MGGKEKAQTEVQPNSLTRGKAAKAVTMISLFFFL
jgi:hypothetical protein